MKGVTKETKENEIKRKRDDIKEWKNKIGIKVNEGGIKK